MAEELLELGGPVVAHIAHSTLQQFRCVAVINNRATYADHDVSTHLNCVRGITIVDAIENGEVLVQILEPLKNPDWNWTPQQPLYVGSSGLLTQTRPITGWTRQIGIADSATEIFIDLQPVGEPDKHHKHNQLTASDTWVVTHNLQKRPAVTVVDSGNSVVIGDVTYDSDNQVTLRFSSAFAGKAYFN